MKWLPWKEKSSRERDAINNITNLWKDNQDIRNQIVDIEKRLLVLETPQPTLGEKEKSFSKHLDKSIYNYKSRINKIIIKILDKYGELRPEIILIKVNKKSLNTLTLSKLKGRLYYMKSLNLIRFGKGKGTFACLKK